MKHVFVLLITGLLAGCAGGSWTLGSLSNLSYAFDSPVGNKAFKPVATAIARPPALGGKEAVQSARRAE